MTCGAEHVWTGTGRRRHSSLTTVVSRCTREAGHAGPHAYERVATPAVETSARPAPTPAPAPPAPISARTLSVVRELRARFYADRDVIPLPTTERAGAEQIAAMRGALLSPMGRHSYRNYLEGRLGS